MARRRARARRVARARVGAGGGARLERNHPLGALGAARLESDTALTLSFEGGEAAGDGYDISAPETVAVEVPAAACSSGQDVPVVPSFIIRAQSGAASMHGALLNASDELSLVGPGSYPLYLTLHGSEWTRDVGRERDATLAVLRSIVSEQSEAAGWNRVVRVGLEPRHVARIDDTTLRLTVPQFGLYSISVPETIGVSLPPAAVSSASNLSSSALLTISPRRGRAFVSGGSLPRDPAEATLRAGRSTLEVELLGDSWRQDPAENTTAEGAHAAGSAEGAAATALLLGSLTSAQNGSHGWNAVVGPLLARHGALRLLSAAHRREDRLHECERVRTRRRHAVAAGPREHRGLWTVARASTGRKGGQPRNPVRGDTST